MPRGPGLRAVPRAGPRASPSVVCGPPPCPTYRAGGALPVRYPRVGSAIVADWKRGVRRVLYPAYEARVVRRLPADRLPKHVGVMLDGNRRWARAVGQDAAHGHRAGAANISPLLRWCEELGVRVVTLWLLSTENLNRPPEELSQLLAIIEEAVADLAAERRWRLHPVGALDLLPAETARRLKEAADETRDVDGIMVNIAVGYGGRREIADAVRSLLQEHASRGTSIEELAEVL